MTLQVYFAKLFLMKENDQIKPKPSDIAVYLKEDVDKYIAELKEKNEKQ